MLYCERSKSLYNITESLIINVSFPNKSLTIYYLLSFKSFSFFFFFMRSLRDNFVKSLIISLFNSKLTTFLNIYENVKTTYSKLQRLLLLLVVLEKFIFNILKREMLVSAQRNSLRDLNRKFLEKLV